MLAFPVWLQGGETGKDVDAEVSQRYLSPSFKFK